MKRALIISILWVFSIALAAGTAYWVGLQQERILSVENDLQIIQPLNESQRQMLLRTPVAGIMEGMVVTVAEPGKPPQLFLAKGKLDLPDKPYKKPNPPLYNPFKDDKPPKKPPEVVAYPCQVGRDSAGKVIWGICYRRKF